MATLNVKLNLDSKDARSDALNFTVSDTLTTTDPISEGRKSIATGSAQEILASNSAFSYTYIKVISGTNTTDYVQVKLAGNVCFKMRVGEFAFFPGYNAHQIQGESYGGACIVEFKQWSIS
tara:strand:- start:48 stop:410 length:363 start_codon:yes stop_codon:yes gene_type:complete